ncbi:MAG: LysR family transcriptional regulator [Pirellulales bacterium]|nr:LysR family transcriptional regulator [Pirellulales bacterium]
MDWLNYHHLQYFWLTAQEGSISRASELLHVTPATVSIQIRELEKSLGVKLFRKAGRGLAVTDVGETVFRYARDIFAQGRELQEVLRGEPSGHPRLLRVGIKDVMPKLVAYQLLEPALQQPERLRLICQEGSLTRLAADLGVHQLDVVLSDTPLDPAFKIRAYSHLLGESAAIVVGTRKLAEKYREGYPGSLDHAPFLLPTEQSVLRRSLEGWFGDHSLRPDIRAEFDDSAMLKIAGRAGAGLFVIPEVIQAEVQTMYGVEFVGRVSGVSERFYALSAERKLKHPAVVAISAQAKRRLSGG